MSSYFDGKSLVVSSIDSSAAAETSSSESVSISGSLSESLPESESIVSSEVLISSVSYAFVEKPFSEYSQMEGFFIFGFVLVLFVGVVYIFGRAGRGRTDV